MPERIWCELCGIVTEWYVESACPTEGCFMSDYDPEEWYRPNDRLWALREAAKLTGMMPNAETTARLLKHMALDGLVREFDTFPAWGITDKGLEELLRLENANRKIAN